MQLSEENISDFQKLYKKHFGKDISKKEALEKGLCVLAIVRQMTTHYKKESDLK